MGQADQSFAGGLSYVPSFRYVFFAQGGMSLSAFGVQKQRCLATIFLYYDLPITTFSSSLIQFHNF